MLLKDWIIKNLPPFIYTIYDEPSEDPFEKLEYISIDGTEGFKYSSYGMYGQDIVVLLDKENNLIYLISASFVNTNATIRGDLWYLLNSFSLLNNQ